MQVFAAQAASAAGLAGRRAMSSATAARPVLATAYTLPQDLMAQKVGPKWRAARISRRKAAVMRKFAILDGTYGKYDAATGQGWEPEWDTKPKAMVARPPKGKKHTRVQADRIAKIQQNLAEMDKKIADYKKSRPKKAKKDSLTALLSKKDPWDGN